MKTLFTLFIALTLSAIAADEFVLLGATEAQLTERYGKPESTLPSIRNGGLNLWENLIQYKVDDLVIYAHMFKGRAEMVTFLREGMIGAADGVLNLPRTAKWSLSNVHVKQILERCGGEWKQDATVWSRKDGATASRGPFKQLTVTSPVAAKALEEFENEKAKDQKPIKGL